MEFFKSSHLSTGIYRALLIDVREKTSIYGTTNLIFHYVLVSQESNKSYFFEETFSDDISVGRSAEFFWFLKVNHIDFEEFHELAGLVFDAVLQYDYIAGKELPILIEKELIAPPPRY